MRFLTRTTLSEAFGIVPDLEGITLDHAIDRAYRRALFAFGNPSIAEKHALEVTSTLARKWQKERGRQSDDESKGYFVQPNRAFQIELTSFIKLNAYKKDWLSDYHSGNRHIDRETMAVWFIDHIVNYGLKRHSSYAAIGILKVLFNYAYEDIDEVLQYTDRVRWGGARDRKDDLRRWKRKLFKDLIEWFGENLLKLKQSEQSEDLFPEHRFINEPVSAESVKKTFATLRFYTPLRPKCPLDQDRNINIRDLETFLKAHANSASEHALERERIHVMNHPEDLFYVVNNASNRDVKPPAEYLELPDFRLGKDGDGPPPIDRQKLPSLDAQARKHLERHVLRRKKQISKLAFESVIIAVDDEERLELDLEASQTVQLRLNEGDTLVELRSRDQEGSLPLDSFFVSWNSHLLDSEPFRYRTQLGRKHQIDFLLNYERDSSGDFSGAVLQIQYRLLIQEETTGSLFEQIAAGLAAKGFSKLSIVGFAFVAFALLLFPVYLFFTSGGPVANTDHLGKSSGNSQQTVKTPSPSPDYGATPGPTPTASPTVAQRQPSHNQKSDAQKYELIARANLLILDEYRKPSQTDQSQRGEEPGQQNSGSSLRIYASRNGLTSLRMKLPEAAPETPDVVSLDDGFFHPVVTGTIESANNGIVTVTFDLRTIRYKKYYLRVASGDKRPKHYLVKLVNAASVLPRKPDERRR